MQEHNVQLSLWAWFVAASLATVAATHTLWAFAWYRGYLTALAIVSLLLAVLVIRKTGIRPWPVAGIAIGLGVGQWWLLQSMLLALVWRSNGFGP
ncbi:conserved membrane hypothetical protein [Burkholderiales bacterium 8X]|nr:conserved membrane hypothetical protein [Burkholderiales bacterium 8X]